MAEPGIGVITSAPTAVPTVKTGNLSNQDFRVLLTQTKAEKPSGRENNVEDARLRKQKKRNARMESYKKWQQKKEKYKEKQELKYRDRAKERRDDTNPDYTNVEQYDVSVEKSKFLGGDLEHTHLVKGLDFALANKMREEMEKKEEERLEKEFEEKEKQKVVAPVIKEPEKPGKKKKKRDSNLQFMTPLGRSIYRIAVENVNVVKRLEHFIPGRMVYEFDLDENFSSDIPTTVLQSKYDLPHDEDRCTGLVDGMIRKKVDKIMKFLRQDTVKGKKRRHKKKQEDEEDEDENLDEEIKKKAMVSNEDDIFPSTGEEIPTSKLMPPPQVPPKSYFGDSKASTDSAPQADETDAKEEEGMEEKEGEEGTEEKEKKTLKETYSEYDYYPSGGGGDDSDDEDLTKMDQGRGRSRLRPWDFDTDEQWERYNHLKEATPKAAFQFGLKMKDGRKPKHSKARTPAEADRIKERRKEQQFNKEWQQIQQIIKKREVARGPGPKKQSVEESRMAKRQKILRGFAK